MGIFRFKDRKGIEQVFDSKERSTGLVNRIYEQGNRFEKKQKRAKEFVAQVTPFTPEPTFTEAYIVHGDEKPK